MAHSDGTGRLTTHVLDAARGCPAAGMTIELFSFDGDVRTLVSTVQTNADGRTDRPMLDGDALKTGSYELVFHAGDYLAGAGTELPDVPFLDMIPIRFGISDATAHYHVPLLLSPYAYSTYRGS